MKKRITNTTSHDQHPEWLFGLNPTAIEQQEAQGQQEFVHSCQLPTDMDADCLASLKGHGIAFLRTTEDDPLFYDVVLPDGWQLRPTEHPMWNDLVNASGKIIAAIFYKAAFYDRKASCRLATHERTTS